MGYVGALRDMGLFIVEAVEMQGPPDTITIQAKAAPFDSADAFVPFQSRKTRSFDQATLGALVEGIAGEHGLEAAIDPLLAAIPIPHIDQTHESDMNLLTRLARDAGALMKPMFGRLVFARRGAGQSVTGKPLGSVTLTRDEVSSYRFQNGRRRKFKRVKTRWHDPKTASTVEEVAGELVGDSIGGAGDSEKEYSHPHAFASQAEAQQAARAYHEAFMRKARTGQIVLPGRAELSAEMSVTLLTFRPQINGPWIAKKVEHRLSRGTGFQTTLDLEDPATASAEAAEKAAKIAKAANGSDPLGTVEAKAAKLLKQDGVSPVSP
jgi:phage protein D